MSGFYFIFEGCDNCGKSTVSKIITEWLNDNVGVSVAYTRHPGSTPIGVELRKIVKESTSKIDPHTEALIMAADNSAFINQILTPSLAKGDWIIADRNNFISSMAYQTASGCSLEELDTVHAATSVNPPKADILFIFTAPLDVLEQRKSSRGIAIRDNFEDRGATYMSKVKNAYDNLSPDRLSKFVKQSDGNLNVKIIDTNKPLNEVVEDVKDIILAYNETYND